MKLLAPDVVVCPTCDCPVSPSSTVCGECGERLQPQPVVPEGCTCGGRGLCLACAIDEIERAQRG